MTLTNGVSADPRVDGEPAAAGLSTADELQGLVHRMLELLGEDPERDGLLDTPARVQQSLQWLTHGSGMTAADAVGSAVFDEDHRSMVVVRDIEFYSLCEHHMLPFFGRVHIGYVPSGKILGLSKLARLVDVYSRRLQVQERLTEQLASVFEDVVHPEGVGVVIEASHLCMMMRGVRKQGSTTVTTAARGSIADDGAARTEFLRMVR